MLISDLLQFCFPKPANFSMKIKSHYALWLALNSDSVASSHNWPEENKGFVLLCKIEILDKFGIWQIWQWLR